MVPYILVYDSDKPMAVWEVVSGLVGIFRPTILFDAMQEKAKIILLKKPDQKYLVRDYINGEASFSSKLISVVGGAFLLIVGVLRLVFDIQI